MGYIEKDDRNKGRTQKEMQQMRWKVIKVTPPSSIIEKAELYCNLLQNSTKDATETI